MKKLIKWFSALFIIFGLAASTQARDLVIGVTEEPAVDPHYLFMSNNIEVSHHMFEGLTKTDANSKLHPSLAVSWEMLEPTVWEFKLRQGVRFHDGSRFTAKDVAFSYQRIPNLKNNPNPFTPLVRNISKVEIVDDYTIRLITSEPDPTLPYVIPAAFIVSHQAAKDATPSDFKRGRAAVGTGPYAFSSFKSGVELVVKKNSDYWGEVEPWDTVTFRVLGSSPAVIAALSAGDIDVMGNVTPSDVITLKNKSDITVASRSGERVSYLIMDMGRDQTPEITDKDGNPLEMNPLKDVRVREALSLAINRQAIIDGLLDGIGSVANQLVPPAIVGYNENIPEAKFDPEKAKRLLKEAGWPEGFGITLRGPNNAYGNGKSLQAIAQMWARLGFKMQVLTEPKSTYFPHIKVADGVDYSVMIMGWGFSEGNECTPFYNTVLHSYDAERGLGPANRAYFKDAYFDAQLEAAQATLNADRRAAMLEGLSGYVTHEFFALPIYWENVTIAFKDELKAEPRADAAILAMDVRPK